MKRDKKGRIKAAQYRRDFDAGANKWARVRDTLREIGGDPRLTGDAGRKHFMGEITSADFQAVVSFGAMMDIYDWKILGVRRSVPAHVLGEIRGGDSVERWDDERLAQFRKRYEFIEEGLVDAGGVRCRDDIKKFCRGEYVPLAAVRRGLDVLIDLLKIPEDIDGAAQITDDEKYKVLRSA